MTISIKRIYTPIDKTDGFRVLVDRLWPRGISKDNARLDMWAKELAPSTELRTWFHANTNEFAQFRERYRAELLSSEEARETMHQLERMAAAGPVTLLYSSRFEPENNASVLAELIQEKTFEPPCDDV
ncbi:DUF488 domain-containing protein [Alicyclobacillus ferrooxydans]|uniref:Uroporphyrin-III methyltransferase n=1 Tax=Alicyclobacillus ferrooxydans TaxID=471514 RepID=A0A0N8PPQ5_9BACL|nr:DUF488 family protein [Alicyclobacillus ferrooxydans]KPV44981.1 hypothetical protein AN477_04200 [Alicyclobacillus ferrooxydans]